MLNKNGQKNKAKAFLDFLVDNNYWGELVIKFEVGNIVHLRLGKGVRLEDIDYKEMQQFFVKKKKGFRIVDSAKIEKGDEASAKVS